MEAAMTMALPIAALLGGAVLLGLLTQLTIPPLAWIAVWLILAAVRSMRGAGLLAVWAALAAALVVSQRRILPVSGAPYFVTNVLMAATMTLPFAIDRWLAPQRAGLTSTLILPLAFVTIELLRSRFTPGAATWGSLAYTQSGVLPLMQLTAVTGIWGITFLIAWFASTMELARDAHFNWSAAGPGVIAFASTLFIVTAAGAARVGLAPTDRPALRVAMIHRPVDLFVPGEMTRIAEASVADADLPRVDAKLAKLQQWFLDGAAREARAGARVVTWPEQNLLVWSEREPEFLERAARVAAGERVVLVMGLGTVHRGAVHPFENKVAILGADGQLLASYRKTHPVVGWEAAIMQRGDGRLPMVDTSHGRLTTAICFEADLPEYIRQAGAGGAGVLIVPANDWREIRQQHADMAAFRAVENGVSLVRPTAAGLSVVIDPWGRVLAQMDFFAPGDRTLSAQVSVGAVWTPYASVGDLFGWSCAAALALLMFRSLIM